MTFAHARDGRRSLLLVGTGLIGGSFALAAKANGVFDHVVGLDRSREALDEAQRLGIIDERAETMAGNHDAVCIAVPVGGIAASVRAAAPRAPVVFDVGSVKSAIVEALAPAPANFVPCHPIAGSERQGPAAARADLFDGRLVVLTPVAGTDAAATAAVRAYWEAIGGRVVVDSAAGHDERFAVLSHLPHLVAFAFMEVAGRSGSLEGAGGGFRDFTRIAAADADVWTDILHANAPRVRRYANELIRALQSFADAAHSGGSTLRARIDAAAQIKRTFDETNC